MGKTQQAMHVFEKWQTLTHSFVDGLRTLAAPEDKNMVGRPVFLALDRLELRANGITGHNRALPEIRRSVRVGDRRKVHPSPEHAVSETRQGILFHDDSGIPLKNCRAQHGE